MPPKSKKTPQPALARIKKKFSKKPASCVDKKINEMSSKTRECIKLVLTWMHTVLRATTPAGCSLPHDGKLIVGSACTGLGSELMALDMLRIPYSACFGCELDKKLREMGKHMHGYHHFYPDCCSTDFLCSPTCHLFVCGAPCQPYSKAGLQKALEDPKSGQVLLWILAWIAAHKPEAFILENVEGLCSTHKETLAIILGVLSQLLDSKGKKLYHVEHRLLNLCTHGSIPQNRPRLFVVGLRMDRLDGREFSWPSEAGVGLSPAPLWDSSGFGKVCSCCALLSLAGSDSTHRELRAGQEQAKSEAEQYGGEEPENPEE